MVSPPSSTRFDTSRATRAITFIEGLSHVKGQWAGQPFRLLDWQRELIGTVFGTIRADGTRQYRTCYVEVPRKNGKSSLAGAIALYLLCADGEPGAEVYGAAGDRDQAGIVFAAAAEMARATPVLASRLKIIDSTKRIIYKGSYYRAIPADASGSHGFNASGIILDEAHVQPNRELYDVLVTSVGARRQPLVFVITTAGYDRNSLCWELHEYARQVRDGIITDPTFLPVLFAADDNDDWTEPATWRKANPSLGHTISEEFLTAECAKAREVPAYQNTFRRLYLNQWTNQETRWLDMAAWDRGAGDIDEADLIGRVCYGGLDLASTTDIAAMALVFPQDDGRMAVRMRFWMPADTMHERERRDRVPYSQWASQGLITATPGNVIDYQHIRADVAAVADTYDLREVAYDPWNATQLILQLQDGGLTCVPVRQGFASLSAPTKEVGSLVLSDRLLHGGHPVLRWMADNVMVSQDPAGNIKPDKAKSTQRIDGIVALVMAVDRVSRHEGESVYETRGVLTL